MKIGDKVRLSPDAHVLPEVREIIAGVGEILDRDEMHFDWLVCFPESGRRGGMFGFNTEDLILDTEDLPES